MEMRHFLLRKGEAEGGAVTTGYLREPRSRGLLRGGGHRNKRG